MQQKCDLCNKTAMVHEVTVRNGVKKEIHLCETHAREAGIVVPGEKPINQLLTQFVISQTGKGAAKPASKSSSQQGVAVKSCPGCGMSFAQFRQVGRMGCAQCYNTFEAELSSLIERAQSGGTHHCGKAPQRSGASVDRELLVQRLARELDQAVAAEQYERAAQLRDRLSTLDSTQSHSAAPSPSASPSAPAVSSRARQPGHGEATSG